MSGFSRWGQMSERKQFRAIKGTRDILPPDSALWNWFEHTAREVFESYNFGEIRLPIFEPTALFARSIGAETDVVSKEMYTFEDPPRLEDPVMKWKFFEAFLRAREGEGHTAFAEAARSSLATFEMDPKALEQNIPSEMLDRIGK